MKTHDKKCKEIKCIETNETWSSTVELCKALNFNENSFRVLFKTKGEYKGMHYEFVK